MDCDHALKKLTTGIYIVTSKQGLEINGMVASWVSQISFKFLKAVIDLGDCPATYNFNIQISSSELVILSSAIDTFSLIWFCSGKRPGV